MVWHKANADASFDANPSVELFSHISALLDQKRGEAVLLDEKHGRYWHLSGKLLTVILIVSQSPHGTSFQDLRNYPDICTQSEEESLREALHELAARGLIKIGKTEKEKVQSPSLRLILQYAVLYLWYTLLLRIKGWDLVWAIRSKQQAGYGEMPVIHQPKSISQLQLIENVSAAIRFASVFTWVHSDCVPSSLATYHLLRALKYPPVLMIGASIVPFEPHMWVELAGYRLDAEVNEHSLTTFDTLSEASARNGENASDP